MNKPSDYKQKPITVSAIQWNEEVGPQFGVRQRPKKHKANPDEYYIRTRFGKEVLIGPGDWIVTYKDGANERIEAALFPDLYELVPEAGECPPTTTKE